MSQLGLFPTWVLNKTIFLVNLSLWQWFEQPLLHLVALWIFVPEITAVTGNRLDRTQEEERLC